MCLGCGTNKAFKGGVKDDTMVWSCGGRMDENVFACLLAFCTFVCINGKFRGGGSRLTMRKLVVAGNSEDFVFEKIQFEML